VLLEVAELMGIDTAQCIAVGDGANDLPMMEAAGLSIAYHPKPAVAAPRHDLDHVRRHGPGAGRGSRV
jgi:phosphoserine phosphatase